MTTVSLDRFGPQTAGTTAGAPSLSSAGDNGLDLCLPGESANTPEGMCPRFVAVVVVLDGGGGGVSMGAFLLLLFFFFVTDYRHCNT